MKKRVFMMGCIMALGLVGCTAKEGNKPDALAIPIEGTVEGTVEGTENVEQVETNEEITAENTENKEETAEQTEAVADNEVTEEAGREDGERFEGVIILEGTEETVNYEHAKNSALGFEIDYEYESLTRVSSSEGEKFISIYEDENNASNYLEIVYSMANFEATVENVSEELSANYEISTEEHSFGNVGICKRIYATNPKDNSGNLQTVYVIPCGEGSLIATEHYTFESAEGFGRRFDNMLDTLKIK